MLLTENDLQNPNLWCIFDSNIYTKKKHEDMQHCTTEEREKMNKRNAIAVLKCADFPFLLRNVPFQLTA